MATMLLAAACVPVWAQNSGPQQDEAIEADALLVHLREMAAAADTDTEFFDFTVYLFELNGYVQNIAVGVSTSKSSKKMCERFWDMVKSRSVAIAEGAEIVYTADKSAPGSRDAYNWNLSCRRAEADVDNYFRTLMAGTEAKEGDVRLKQVSRDYCLSDFDGKQLPFAQALDTLSAAARRNIGRFVACLSRGGVIADTVAIRPVVPVYGSSSYVLPASPGFVVDSVGAPRYVPFLLSKCRSGSIIYVVSVFGRAGETRELRRAVKEATTGYKASVKVVNEIKETGGSFGGSYRTKHNIRSGSGSNRGR